MEKPNYIIRLSRTTSTGNFKEFEEDLQNTYYMSNHLEDLRFKEASRAAFACNIEKLKKLVNRANINQINSKAEPIIFATLRRSFKDTNAPIEKTLNFLLDNGAYLYITEPGQAMTAFEYAALLSAKSKTHNFRALDFFISQGADPFIASVNKPSLFDTVSHFSNYPKIYPQANEVLKFFKSKITSLRQAVLACDVEKVEEFANSIANDEKDEDAKTPLFRAVSRFDLSNKIATIEIIKKLLAKGAKPNAGIANMAYPYQTIIAFATIVSIQQGDSGMIPPLLEHGGDPKYSLAPQFGPTAYELAYRAANLTEEDLKKEKELVQIKKNASTAHDILDLFQKYTQTEIFDPFKGIYEDHSI